MVVRLLNPNPSAWTIAPQGKESVNTKQAEYPAMSDRIVDFLLNTGWAQHAPWLAMLWLMLIGLGLPLGLFEALDRWLAGRLGIDRVALATRHGGFMNSWAVFGRGAADYRDLKPLFNKAQAAELARFADGSACMVVRFADAAQADMAALAAGDGRLGSFAGRGVELAATGLHFQTDGEYRCGEWVVVEDTLFGFYGEDDAALRRRRRATPCLVQRPAPQWLQRLASREGYLLVALLWLTLQTLPVSLLLEAGMARLPNVEREPASLNELRSALRGIEAVRLVPEGGDTAFRLERLNDGRPDAQRWRDIALLDDSLGEHGIRLRLRLDPARHIAGMLPLTGFDAAGWAFNLAGSGPEDGALLDATRAAVLAAGWQWRPRLWPFFD